jgi:anti-sigma B factor antagonist
MLRTIPTESAHVLLAAIGPRVDAREALAFRDALTAASAAGAGDLYLDLRDVTFMDSSGLGALVYAFKQLPPGRTMVVCNPAPAVRKLFALTHIDRVIRLVDGEPGALCSAGA